MNLIRLPEVGWGRIGGDMAAHQSADSAPRSHSHRFSPLRISTGEAPEREGVRSFTSIEASSNRRPSDIKTQLLRGMSPVLYVT